QQLTFAKHGRRRQGVRHFLPQDYPQRVLGLGALTQNLLYVCSYCLQLTPGLVDIEGTCYAVIESCLHNVVRLLARGQGALHQLVLLLGCTKNEVRLSNQGDKTNVNRALCFLSSQILLKSGLAQVAQPTEEVQFE